MTDKKTGAQENWPVKDVQQFVGFAKFFAGGSLRTIVHEITLPLTNPAALKRSKWQTTPEIEDLSRGLYIPLRAP